MAPSDHLWATLITYVDRDRFWRWRLSGELACSYLALARPTITLVCYCLYCSNTTFTALLRWVVFWNHSLSNLCLSLWGQQQRCANTHCMTVHMWWPNQCNVNRLKEKQQNCNEYDKLFSNHSEMFKNVKGLVSIYFLSLRIRVESQLKSIKLVVAFINLTLISTAKRCSY